MSGYLEAWPLIPWASYPGTTSFPGSERIFVFDSSEL
jgi:hypothetical protein